MTEAARVPLVSAARRKREHDRLARRATTAALSLAICLTGLFTGFAAISRPATSEGTELTLQPGDAESALTKALSDYRAAAAAHDAMTASNATQPKPLAPARTAPAPVASHPAAVSGGS